MRDFETQKKPRSPCLPGRKPGTLVLSTLQTVDATATIQRIILVFRRTQSWRRWRIQGWPGF